MKLKMNCNNDSRYYTYMYMLTMCILFVTCRRRDAFWKFLTAPPSIRSYFCIHEKIRREHKLFHSVLRRKYRCKCAYVPPSSPLYHPVYYSSHSQLIPEYFISKYNLTLSSDTNISFHFNILKMVLKLFVGIQCVRIDRITSSTQTVSFNRVILYLGPYYLLSTFMISMIL